MAEYFLVVIQKKMLTHFCITTKKYSVNTVIFFLYKLILAHETLVIFLLRHNFIFAMITIVHNSYMLYHTYILCFLFCDDFVLIFYGKNEKLIGIIIEDH
jgi:hypothetical protein